MKVLSVLFLGLLHYVSFGLSDVFAQDKSFIISSSNVIKACLDKILLTNNSISINKQFHTCPQTDSVANAAKKSLMISEETETYAATLGGTILRDKVWFFVATSKDEDVGDIKREIARFECKICCNPQVVCGLLPPERPEEVPKDPFNWFAFHLTGFDEGAFNANGLSSAPLNRLFVAGTQGTAGANDYLSFAVNTEGTPTGTKSTIFSNPNSKFALGGTMSREGGMAVQLSATSALWQLSTRKLNNGLPAKAPSSWTVPAYTGYSPDITNTIEVNSGVAGASALKIRYLVYRAFRGVGTTAQQSQIMIQRIDDATGKPLEAAKPLTPFKNAFLAPAEAFQALAIAPNGDLLVFTEYSGACKKMILKAVKLVNGSVSGTAKLLAGCAGLAQSPVGYLGLDIMEEPEDSPASTKNRR